MEPIRLCRHKESGPYGVWWPGDPAGEGGDFDYLLALPRADFDALVKERDQARRQRDGMTEQYEAAMEVIHRNAGARRDGLCGILAWIDEAKKATARADALAALLKEARDIGIPIHRHEIAARIDDALNRKGGDGDAISAAAAQTPP